MATTTFDTLAYLEKLKAAVRPEEQAKIQAAALREIVDERLVTRDYLHLRLKEPEYMLTNCPVALVVARTAILLAALSLIRQ